MENLHPNGTGAGKEVALGKRSRPDKKRQPTKAQLKKQGVTEKIFELTDIKAIKRDMQSSCKSFYRMVDSDWHDGYESQSEHLVNYWKQWQQHVQAVVDLGVTKGLAFERCHDVIKVLADSWGQMLSVSMRGDHEENMGDIVRVDLSFADMDNGTDGICDTEYEKPSNLLKDFWPLLLWSAAANQDVDDDTLRQFIKDAHDWGSEVVTFTGWEDAFQEDGEDGVRMLQGRRRIAALYDDKESWESLNSTKKRHKAKRVIDRRFCGTPDRRTRDYHLYDNDGGDY